MRDERAREEAMIDEPIGAVGRQQEDVSCLDSKCPIIDLVLRVDPRARGRDRSASAETMIR